MKDTPSEVPLTILLVEDNPAHASLIKRIIERQDVPPRIHHVYDGETALHYLEELGATAVQERLPHVVFLDLYLPGLSGHDVLKTIKMSPTLKSIPVMVLSSSDTENDIQDAYALYANSYLVKPLDFNKFEEMIDVLVKWLAWNHNTRP